MLIRRAEIDGARIDVRCAAGRIRAVAPRLAPLPGEPILDAAGGALLPGLHDHHVHVLAWIAARRSVRCGPAEVRDAAELGRRLREAPHPDGWVRGVGYCESVAGNLDRTALDAWVPGRPVRVQHRSGSLWIVNSAALARLGLDGASGVPDGVERDARGRPTGRLFHLDAWLRDRWPAPPPPDWRAVARDWARMGVTGATDATPSNGPAEWALFTGAMRRGELPQRIILMGGPDLPAVQAVPAAQAVPARPTGRDATRAGGGGEAFGRPTRGALKIRLTDPELPAFDGFCDRVARAHAVGRPVAVHCVTRAELVLTLAVLEEVGTVPGDRIEHAGIAPPETVDAVHRLGAAVVTQPHFVRERGDAYWRDVDPADRPWLYRCRGWLDAGVSLAAGTDAPFGDADPWAAMRAALDRRSRGGRTLGPAEALDPEAALALFTSPGEAPGAAPRAVTPGAPADLCVLDRPWRRAREHLDAGLVVATVRAGTLLWSASDDRERAGTPRAPVLNGLRAPGAS